MLTSERLFWRNTGLRVCRPGCVVNRSRMSHAYLPVFFARRSSPPPRDPRRPSNLTRVPTRSDQIVCRFLHFYWLLRGFPNCPVIHADFWEESLAHVEEGTRSAAGLRVHKVVSDARAAASVGSSRGESNWVVAARWVRRRIRGWYSAAPGAVGSGCCGFVAGDWRSW